MAAWQTISGFRTISDYRKDNKGSITKVFKEFNKFYMGLKLFSKSYISIDGSKFKAVNVKDNNLRLTNWMIASDVWTNTSACTWRNLMHLTGKKNASYPKMNFNISLRYARSARNVMRNTVTPWRNQTKTDSLTDPDARLMKSNEGFCVGYNVQRAVDADSNMIAGFQITNNPTGHGQITSVAIEVKMTMMWKYLKSQRTKGTNVPKTIPRRLHQESSLM